MSNLTKALLLSITLGSSAVVWAQTIVSGNTVAQTGGTYQCAALNNADTVTIAVSANNGAAFACNATNAALGVAAGKGRGNVYTIHSNGGNTITATAHGGRFQGATAAAVTADAAAAADTLAATELLNAGT